MSQEHTSMSLWVTLGWTPFLWSCNWLGTAHPAFQGSPIGSQHARTQPWPLLFENANLQFSQTSKPDSGSKKLVRAHHSSLGVNHAWEFSFPAVLREVRRAEEGRGKVWVSRAECRGWQDAAAGSSGSRTH